MQYNPSVTPILLFYTCVYRKWCSIVPMEICGRNKLCLNISKITQLPDCLDSVLGTAKTTN